MLRLQAVETLSGNRVRRRDLLRVGTAGMAGLSLVDKARSEGAAPPSSSKAAACIFIYLAGGPSQFETFDPKPLAPARVRGPWGAIATRLPGVHFSELLPELAARADHLAVLRSLCHKNTEHQPWPMMTGNLQHRTAHGSAVAYLRRHAAGQMPAHVHLGPKLSAGAGPLGAAAEPLRLEDPAASAGIDEFELRAEIDPSRLTRRGSLLEAVDAMRRGAERARPLLLHEAARQRAMDLLLSTRVRDAFDLSAEPRTLRDRYGANSFGRSCLLARRLVEAGTQFVQIVWYNREDGFAVGWDVHGDDQAGLVRMEQQLCPRFDQGLSALIDDLFDHGLLATTLVCATGEFGRTPRISRLGGRDHWPYCFSAVMAGGGLPWGAVVGASDAHGAWPASQPVSPADFAATLYALLGVDVNADDRLRPAIFEGAPVESLVGGRT